MLTEIALGGRITGDLFFCVYFSNFQMFCNMHTALQNETKKNYKKRRNMIKKTDLRIHFNELYYVKCLHRLSGTLRELI